MPKYVVTGSIHVNVLAVVEADSEEEAIDEVSGEVCAADAVDSCEDTYLTADELDEEDE